LDLGRELQPFLPGLMSLAAARMRNEQREVRTRLGQQEWLRLAARLGYRAAATLTFSGKSSCHEKRSDLFRDFVDIIKLLLTCSCSGPI
jgi:hypothetical protein